MTSQHLYVDTAYQIIRETQRKLHAEYVMSSTLEEFLNQDNLKTFKQSFLTQNIEEKHYYTRVLFLTTFNTKKIPFTNNDAFYEKNTEYEIFQIPPIFNPSKCEVFAQKLISLEEKGSLSNQLIDIITFSLIPSFYLMFLEKNSFTLFCKFISKLKKDKKPTQLRYQLSRSLFVSPMFLSFLRKVMHNILQPIYSGGSSVTSISMLKHLILDSFTKNVCFIPSYMMIFLDKKNDVYEFLKYCLFTPMVSNPENFEIIDFNAKNDEKLHNFKEIIKTIFDDEFIKQISVIIKENKDSEKSIFIPDKEEIEQTKAETNTIILDTIDKILLFHIQQLFEGKVDPNVDLYESFKNVKYEMYRSLFKIEEKKDENDVFLKATTIIDSDPWMFFRKLLKDAQPLPVASGLEHVQMNIDMFRKIIVKFIMASCDPFRIVDAEISLQQFSVEFFTDNKIINYENEFTEKMNNLILKHDEQTIVMQLISKFQKELKDLTQSRKSSLDLMNKRFIVHLLDLHKIDENLNGVKIPTKSYDMIKYPQKYLDDFKKYLEIQQPKALKLISLDCHRILSGRFYQNLDFYTYLAVRSDLRKFDDITSDVFMKFINEAFENVNGKMEKIVKKVKNMSVFNSSFSKLYDSFLMNGDPITKLVEISSWIDKLIKELIFYSGEFGPDYFVPFINYVFASICPSHFVSNVVFIAEYLDYFNNKAQIEIDNMFLSLVAVFESITEKEPIFHEYPLIRLTRTMNKRCELFISGNDPRIVAESLNALVTMINKRHEMSDENIASLADDMNRERGKIFLLQIPALRFNKKKMVFFIIFDIRVGVDISLDKIGNKDYMLRLALFFFQRPRMFGGRSELRNFINYNQIDKEHKRIIPLGEFNPSDANGIQVLDSNDCWENISKDIINVFSPPTDYEN